MSWEFHTEYTALQQELLRLVHAADGPVLPNRLMRHVTKTSHISRVRLALDALAELGEIEWTNVGYSIPGREIDQKTLNTHAYPNPRYLRATG